MSGESIKKAAKLTIITICYNEEGIEKTCKSIVNQTFQDFEWIVVDGGSNKATLDIFEKYKNRIDTFISEPDNGIYDAMNKGIKTASGEYLNFLNAGDFYADNSVLEQVLKAGLDKDIVYGNMFMNEKGSEFIKIYGDSIDLFSLYIDALPHSSSFIKRELFTKYGLYDNSFKIAGDLDKWIVFLILNNCSYKHIDIGCSVFSNDGISSNNAEFLNKEKQKALAKYFNKKEIKKIVKNEKDKKWSFVQRIFSIKNIDNNYKVMKILGISIKYKRKRK